MAIQEQPALADRVYALLGELDAAEVGSDTELAAIGFDSLAAAELGSTWWTSGWRVCGRRARSPTSWSAPRV